MFSFIDNYRPSTSTMELPMFKICKEILDSYSTEICKTESISQEELKEQVDIARREQMEAYRSGQGRPTYSTAFQKFGYIRTDITVHVNLIQFQLGQWKPLADLLDMEQVKILSIGGGPATDLIALMRKMDLEEHSVSQLFYRSFDIENWKEVWRTHMKPEVFDKHRKSLDIEGNVSGSTENNLIVNTEFKIGDLCSNPFHNDASRMMDYIETADLFTFMFVASEIVKNSPERVHVAEENIKKIMTNAKAGALFLFVDISQSEVSDWFQEVHKSSNVSFDVKISMEDEYQLKSREEKTDLGVHYSENMQPRLGVKYGLKLLRKKEAGA